MRHSCLRLACCLFAFSAACSTSVFAQSDSAEISGRITDPSGAVIAGAQVQLRDLARGTTTEVTSNRSGLYAFPIVRPGNYSMAIAAPGFSHLDLLKVTANTQDHLEQNFKLSVGSASESMTVNSDDRVDLGTSISTSIDHRFIENMPLNGQSIQQLIAITPGVQRTSGAGQFSFNGVRDNSNYTTVDGVSANVGTVSNPNPAGLGQYGAGETGGYTAIGTSSSLGSLGDIQEIKVQASSYSAEFGRAAGGQIQLTSQSGTSSLHGSVFDYLRNEDFDAVNSYTKYQAVVTRVSNPSFVLVRPKLRQNDFGGTVGGPIWIPHIYDGRKKSFFFVSIEALLLQQPLSVTANVPAACFKTNSCTLAGAAYQPPAGLLPYLQFEPNPNVTVNGAPAYAATFSNPSSSTASSVRLDHQLTSRLQLFGRASYTPSRVQSRPAGGISQATNQRYDLKTFTFGANSQISSHIANETRVNYSRNTGQTVYTLDTFGGATLPTATMNAQMFPSQYGAAPVNSVFEFDDLVGGALGSYSYLVGTNNANTQRQFNLVDNLTYVVGSHNLKFGVDFRRLFPVAAPYVYSQAQVFILSSELLSGIPDYSNVNSNDKVTVHIDNLSFYGQDTWKVTSQLTLDYGLRLDFNPAPHGDDNTGQLYATTSVATPATATLAAAGTALYPTKYGTFQPRVGASYEFYSAPNYESILTGAFGLYYDTNDDTATNATSYYPHSRATTVTGRAFPGTPLPPPSAPTFVAPYTGQSLLGFDPNFTLPLIYQWNVSLQQGIGRNQAIQFSYVASAGRNLTRRSVYAGNQFANRFLNFNVYSSPDVSNYQSAQVAYQRRLYKNVQVLANYVWAKSLDTTSDAITIDQTPSQLNVGSEYGLSTFDVRNNFNASISYDFPKFSKAFLPIRYVLQDWSADAIFLVHGGNPLSVTFTRTVAGLAGTIYRPDFVPGVPVFLSTPTTGSAVGPFGGKRLNPAAFSTAYVAGGTRLQGNEPRGYIPSNAVRDLDFTLRREFILHDSFHLQFRADAFNVLNQTLYANYNLTLGSYGATAFSPSSTFGLTEATLNSATVAGTSNLGGGFYGIGRNRSLQLALKIKF